MLAALVQTPELALEKTEAANMAQAIGRVSAHYDLHTTQKALDWSNLCMCLAVVYGPRIFAIRTRKLTEKRAQPVTPETPPVSSHIRVPGTDFPVAQMRN